VRVTERFRINGVPVADAAFVEAFWEVWDALHVSYAAEKAAAQQPRSASNSNDGSNEGSSSSSSAHSSSSTPISTTSTNPATAGGAVDGAATAAVGGSPLPLDDAVPGYFRLITLVALWLFAKLEVSVAVVEVGCGGRFDATNIIGAAFPPLKNDVESNENGDVSDDSGDCGDGGAATTCSAEASASGVHVDASASASSADSATSAAASVTPPFQLVYPLNEIWNNGGSDNSSYGSSHSSGSRASNSSPARNDSSTAQEKPLLLPPLRGWRLGRVMAAGVTTLDLDHMQTLGDTLTAIAWEKGGVFKVPGAACVATPQPADCAAAEVRQYTSLVYT